MSEIEEDLEKISQEFALKVAKFQDNMIKQKLIDFLVTDKHFIKWLKSHYDLYLIRKPITLDKTKDYSVFGFSFRYEFATPKWITLTMKIKRFFRRFKK